ncbi:hypothetical protein [Falsirhodobacter sp. 20TX0035]|uniref:hypothetical protein n=1 Tax=Falsirhodobacter sp. 20TX0035 TaxID=3022019 RepID=UPI00232EF0D7|nr:hypothetical protein [Falsirhodobacter sp. 20TX0035]MDB6454697.1 hypothetical protein [Falsirhodobacter sp. 20TX0035]
MSKPPMTDQEIYEALHDALRPFFGRSGATPHGDTVIKATIKALSGMQIGLLMIEAKGEQTPPPPALEA